MQHGLTLEPHDTQGPTRHLLPTVTTQASPTPPYLRIGTVHLSPVLEKELQHLYLFIQCRTVEGSPLVQAATKEDPASSREDEGKDS